MPKWLIKFIMNNFTNMSTFNHVYITGQKAATQLLKSFFMYSGKVVQGNSTSALISNPVYLIKQTGNGNVQITVQLSYYLAESLSTKSMQKLNSKTLKTLTNALTQVFHMGLAVDSIKPEVQLELVRLQQPYMDASILAEYLAINISTRGFNYISNLLLNAVPYIYPQNYKSTTQALNNEDWGNSHVEVGDSVITGIKVQLSGLLTSQGNRSRKTVYTTSAGTFNNSGLPNGAMGAVDHGTHTSKSELGSFTVKVWIASVNN